MPEKTKQNEETKQPLQKKEPQTADDGNWSKDQKEKSYYYDDSHGYEIYNPEDDEDDEDDE